MNNKRCLLTGLSAEDDLRKSQYRTADTYLTQSGYKTVSPDDIRDNFPDEMSNLEYVNLTMFLMGVCDAVAVIPGSEYAPVPSACLAQAYATSKDVVDLVNVKDFRRMPTAKAPAIMPMKFDVMHPTTMTVQESVQHILHNWPECDGEIEILNKAGNTLHKVRYQNGHTVSYRQTLFESTLKTLIARPAKIITGVKPEADSNTINFTITAG